MAKANGLTVPRTTCINDMQDVEKVADTFTFPVIIKPLSVEHGEQIGFKYKILNRNGFMQEELWNSYQATCSVRNTFRAVIIHIGFMSFSGADRGM